MEFKPLTNNFNNKSLYLPLNRVSHVIKYRHIYQYKSLNIFLHNSKRSKIINFETEQNCDDVFEYLKSNAKNLDLNYHDIEHHKNLWIDGLMSNYDYLMYLNNMASRSFSDISQYPVMPWVLTNYDEEGNLLNQSINYQSLIIY